MSTGSSTGTWAGRLRTRSPRVIPGHVWVTAFSLGWPFVHNERGHEASVEWVSCLSTARAASERSRDFREQVECHESE